MERINRNRKKTKVMLVFPPFSQPVASKKRCLVPLGIAYIGAHLREKGHEVKLLDCVVEGYHDERVSGNKRTFGLSPLKINREIAEFEPDILGVSCLMTVQEQNALNVLKTAKIHNPHVHTVIGGCHASVFYKRLKKNPLIDTVVVGEGEKAFEEIIDKRRKGVIKRCPMDINKIPPPARDLLPIEKYLEINMPENIFSPNKRVTQMVTSRGCPFHCVFCATTNFHGKWRGTKAEKVIQEAEGLVDNYNIDEINIIDENLVFDKNRTKEIMKGFKKLDIAWSNPGGIWIQGLDNELLTLMKEAGCYQLTFPVESSNPKILKEVIRKPLDIKVVKPLVKHSHKIGIDIHAFFVCGFPQQSKQDMINDFNYAKEVGFDSASFHIITPLPGSEIYEKYKDKVDLKNIDYTKATLPHPELSPEEIEDLVKEFNIKFNKSYFWRHPMKFMKKYVGTSMKKYSIWDLPKMFERQ